MKLYYNLLYEICDPKHLIRSLDRLILPLCTVLSHWCIKPFSFYCPHLSLLKLWVCCCLGGYGCWILRAAAAKEMTGFLYFEGSTLPD